MDQDACKIVTRVGFRWFTIHVGSEIKTIGKLNEASVLPVSVKALEMESEDVWSASDDETFHGNNELMTRITTIAVVTLQGLRLCKPGERVRQRVNSGDFKTEIQEWFGYDASMVAFSTNNRTL